NPRKEPEVIQQSEDEAREYAENIINTVREPLVVLDQYLRVVKVSRSFYEVFKDEPEEVIGQLIYDLGNKQWDIPKLRELLETILPQKATFEDYEVEYDFPTIGRRTMLLNARQIPRALGKEKIILLAIEDITERKLLENELLQIQEENFRNVFDNAGDGILLADMGSKKFSVGNKAICRMLGYSPEEIKDLGIKDIHPEKDIAYITDQFEGQAKGEISLSRDLPVKKKDGTIIYADVNATNVTFAGKSHLMRFFHDNTERKQAEESLRESNEYLENLFNHANAPIVVWDTKFRITRFNRAFEILTGRNAADVIGQSLEILFPPDRVESTMDLLRETQAGKRLEGIEVHIQRRAGQVRMLLWSSANIFTADAKTQVATIAQGHDVTERMQVEHAMRKREQLYRSLFENMINGFSYCRMLFDQGKPRDFIYLRVNDAFEKQTGLKNVNGRRVSNVIPGIYEADPHLFEIYGRVALTGIPEKFETYVSSLGMWFSMSIYSPEKEYFVTIFDVITERKQSEEKLLKSYESVKKTLNDA
ncbi:MAG: PAS domain S-box protein, partial [Deltaproteobacteria bacterium]